ncbi:hypothetical protein QR680_015440 [Steinernema hermaphroditum]|uniref:Peptidase M28 domain-containing protein n=1 Tax=Steinernema hermaphroditum TaxID=289476 RepID=A0AA39H8M5_9BILA|nr:hypothetical protein QR680_015440 [Steinernema hermaphroditum]
MPSQEHKITVGAYCTTLEDYLQYLQLQKDVSQARDSDKDVTDGARPVGVESPLLEDETDPSSSSADFCYDSEYSSTGSSSLSTQQTNAYVRLKRSDHKMGVENVVTWKRISAVLCLGMVILTLLSIGFFVAMLIVGNTKCDTQPPKPLPTPGNPYEFVIYENKTKSDAISAQLMAHINSTRIRDNIRWLASDVHVSGTPENMAVMDRLAEEYRKLGLKVDVREYEVLLSYPDYSVPNTIELKTGKGWWQLSNGLAERLGPKEARKEQADPRALLYFNAYSGNGSVEGEIVYANYCRDEDFAVLMKKGIDIKTRIVLCRYGDIFRGDKAKNAQMYGAVGVIIYTDPHDYAPNYAKDHLAFPDQIWMPPSGAQRGSLLKGDGDPLTPFYPSKEYTYRSETIDSIKERSVIPDVPVMPIGYRDAVKIMASLNGPEVTESTWQGAMNATYRYTGIATFRLTVRSSLEKRLIKNVIATMPGAVEPDRWVMFGNHVDAWVKGSVDPNSGTAVLLEMARATVEVANKTGWRPRRSLVFCQWDAEEFGLIGSTEYVEEFLKPLQQRAVAMINVDNINGNNTLSIKAVPLLYESVVDAAGKVGHPNPEDVKNGRHTLLDAWKFYDPQGPLPGDKSVPYISVPGSGSDFQRFISYVGVPVVDLKMICAPQYTYMLYHTMYETPWLTENLIDPSNQVFAAVGQMWLELGRNLADSVIIPFNAHHYSTMLIDFVRQMDANLRKTGVTNVMGQDFYGKAMQHLSVALEDFGNAADRLQHYVYAIHSGEKGVTVRQLEQLNSRIQMLERAFISDQGIYPERSFYRHVVFTSSEMNDYGGVTFALIMDPVERWLQSTNDHERDHWLKTIKMGFTRLQYAIESATLTIKFDYGF